MAGLKYLTDAGRARSQDFVASKFGIPHFAKCSALNPLLGGDYEIVLHKKTGDEDGQPIVTGKPLLDGIAEMVPFCQTDPHKCPMPLPQDLDSLEAIMASADIKANDDAMQSMTHKFPHMVCEVKTRKFILSKKPFDNARCTKVIEYMEDDTKPDPESGQVRFPYQLQRHSLRLLCKFLQISDPSVFLSSHKHSMKAVHAVSLTLHAMLLIENGHVVTEKERAQRGPVTLLYKTRVAPTSIGLVPVKLMPSGEEDSSECASEPGITLPQNLFQRNMNALGADYSEKLKNFMFISREDCKLIAPNHKFLKRSDDSDYSDDEDTAQPATAANPPAELDDIDADMEEMTDDI